MAYYECSITIPEKFKDNLIRRLTDAGSLGVIDNHQSIVAYFPEATDINEIKSELAVLAALLDTAGGNSGLIFTCDLIAEQDWNESWKKGFKPIDVGTRFTILPPWEDKKTGRVNLVIDPAMAFGTGHHETTRSCLVLMEQYAAASGYGSFLDLGSGTGILAIAAAKLGFRPVTGIDTDPLAVDAGRENSALNQVTDIVFHEGSLPETGPVYDFIAANLLSGILVKLNRALSDRLKPGGLAILSGILSGQEDEVIEAMEQAGLRLTERHRDGKWISLIVKRSETA